jgi:hypothetical protein
MNILYANVFKWEFVCWVSVEIHLKSNEYKSKMKILVNYKIWFNREFLDYNNSGISEYN